MESGEAAESPERDPGVAPGPLARREDRTPAPHRRVIRQADATRRLQIPGNAGAPDPDALCPGSRFAPTPGAAAWTAGKLTMGSRTRTILRATLAALFLTTLAGSVSWAIPILDQSVDASVWLPGNRKIAGNIYGAIPTASREASARFRASAPRTPSMSSAIPTFSAAVKEWNSRNAWNTKPM